MGDPNHQRNFQSFKKVPTWIMSKVYASELFSTSQLQMTWSWEEDCVSLDSVVPLRCLVVLFKTLSYNMVESNTPYFCVKKIVPTEKESNDGLQEKITMIVVVPISGAFLRLQKDFILMIKEVEL
ncbi:unnamed protein product [Eruca vesicaria subsp. sativa]|uniref:Uncharacterized protein n=1 Tax=Eruca vesicaria subsp. sativa TaxID=29727 RepID=A0ABC8KC85_ERUVS|nr:unnamed protein product [Eruca vesicaria subsp. sativa]